MFAEDKQMQSWKVFQFNSNAQRDTRARSTKCERKLYTNAGAYSKQTAGSRAAFFNPKNSAYRRPNVVELGYQIAHHIMRMAAGRGEGRQHIVLRYCVGALARCDDRAPVDTSCACCVCPCSDVDDDDGWYRFFLTSQYQRVGWYGYVCFGYGYIYVLILICVWFCVHVAFGPQPLHIRRIVARTPKRLAQECIRICHCGKLSLRNILL